MEEIEIEIVVSRSCLSPVELGLYYLRVDFVNRGGIFLRGVQSSSPRERMA